MRDELKQTALLDDTVPTRLLNISNPFSKSKSLLRNKKSAKKSNHNSSNLNSARSKGNQPSAKKKPAKSIKVVKKDYILKPGEGKLRFSKKVKDKVSRPKLLSKNPLKTLKKISPGRQKPVNEKPTFKIPVERVSQYNNFWKLSNRTKNANDSGTNVLIRK